MLNNEQLVSPGMRLLIPDRYFQGIDFPIRKLTNRKIGSPDELREILLQLPFANHIDLPGNNKLGVKAYEFVDLEYTLGAVTGENWFFYGGNDARDAQYQFDLMNALKSGTCSLTGDRSNPELISMFELNGCYYVTGGRHRVA